MAEEWWYDWLCFLKELYFLLFFFKDQYGFKFQMYFCFYMLRVSFWISCVVVEVTPDMNGCFGDP